MYAMGFFERPSRLIDILFVNCLLKFWALNLLLIIKTLRGLQRNKRADNQVFWWFLIAREIPRIFNQVSLAIHYHVFQEVVSPSRLPRWLRNISSSSVFIFIVALCTTFHVLALSFINSTVQFTQSRCQRSFNSLLVLQHQLASR